MNVLSEWGRHGRVFTTLVTISAFSVKSVGLVTSMCRPIIRGFVLLDFGLGISFPLNILKGSSLVGNVSLGNLYRKSLRNFERIF